MVKPPDAMLEIQALKLAYASSLPEKIDDIETALEESLETAAALSHGLAGTAGMYGFDELSETAGQLERLLDSILRRQAGPGADELQRSAALVDSLRRQARADCGARDAHVQSDDG